jgi:hypothetical protein
MMITDEAVEKMHLAIKQGDMALLQELLKTHNNLLLSYEKIYQSAVFWAAHSNQADMIYYLVGMGADANATYEEDSPLREAVASCAFEAIAALASVGINVNSKENDDWTILHIAANWHDADMIEALVRAGADVNVEDDSGLTPLDAAELRTDRVSFSEQARALSILRNLGAKRGSGRRMDSAFPPNSLKS